MAALLRRGGGNYSDSDSDSGTRNSPCSYDQPRGRGQLLSRQVL